MKPYPCPDKTLRELIADRAQKTPEAVFAVYKDRELSYGQLSRQVSGLASGLVQLGLKPGDRVAVMMANHPSHILTFLALAGLGCVWVPINVHLRGPSLEYILEQTRPRAVVLDDDFAPILGPLLSRLVPTATVIRHGQGSGPAGQLNLTDLVDTAPVELPGRPELGDLRCISYTSGTTGPPKGVLMTERMLQFCAVGAGLAASVEPGDVFLVWEPYYHNSGAQVCILALQQPIKLILIPRFSASTFWPRIAKHRITKIHYLGGIIDILLKQPLRPEEKVSRAHIAFGGGCHRERWRPFEERFNLKIQECYGLTEASGFSTLNTTGKVGSIGRALPYFEVLVIDDQGRRLGAHEKGQIIIRGKEPGLIAQGYLDNPQATASAFRGQYLHTGDLGCFDEDGDFFYLGRIKDSIRRRGENISAWEVETVLNGHPEIQESAVIGVAADIGEQEIKAFVRLAEGSRLTPLELIKWLEPNLAYYQIPRFLEFVDSFDKTPTERIRKETLSLDQSSCWDLEQSGYKIQRG